MHIIRRHWRLFVSITAIALFFWLVYLLRSPLLPFIIGVVLAYIFLPVVSWTEKRLPRPGQWVEAKRVLAIFTIYIVMLGLLAILLYLILNTVGSAFATLLHNAPAFTTGALATLQEWIASLELSPEIRKPVDEVMQTAAAAAGDAARDFIMRGFAAIPTTIGLVLGLAALPIFLFYVLKDWNKLSEGFYAGLPHSVVQYTRDIIAIVSDVLGRYIRASMLLGLIVGTMDLIGLLILGVDFALVLAVMAGVTEVIPTLGPWIGGATAVIITLATAPEKALGVAILFATVQVIENSLLVPRVQAAYLQVNPAIAIMLLVIGAYIAGFWGLVLAVPLATTIVQVTKYIINTTRKEDKEVPDG